MILASLVSPPFARAVSLPEVALRELDWPPADLYLPAAARSPGIVLVLGALREGRRYELLAKVARTIAGCGFAVLVPELGRLRELVLGDDAVEDLVAAVESLPHQAGVSGGPVGLIGFSLGGSLALVAAADRRLQGRVACVAAVGAYCRLADMVTAAMSGSLAGPSAYAVVASLAATLPEADRTVVQDAIGASPDSPVEALSRIPTDSVGAQARIVLSAFGDRNAASLIEGVDGLRAVMDGLSPEAALARIDAPIWVLHDERDRFVPIAQLDAMRMAAEGRRDFRSFKLRLLEHTEPVPPVLNPVRLVGDYLPGLVNLYRFAHGPVQAVRRAVGRSSPG
ncbi:MAG TPA: dienelactone hydrolase family protein [Candidatus Dormibacteraeota bacterium]|nr:dienelactone hydrolase family protein [Candidatus Dormibacteraeota bacterium]